MQNREIRPWRVGLAKLRIEGWRFIRLKREAEIGNFITVPFRYEGENVVLNGSGLKKGIALAVIGPDKNRPIPGYEHEKCVVTKDDGSKVKIKWENASRLPTGIYRLHFIFTSLNTKLYSVGFTA